MTLQMQIDKMASEIRTDGYQISIGELISLYESKEIDIHPEFQRFFRWTLSQKSKFIESILLNIPLPPIFVIQRDDGVWDVVDGLQRLSTLYEFFGILKDENGDTNSPLILSGTKYLPDLQGKSWGETANSLDTTQRLLIKRSKIYVNIILRKSDEKAKYELFMRLNTGGSLLSPQEVRNCILVQINRDLFFFIKELSENEDFQTCISITDSAIEEQYDIELVLRFIIFRSIALSKLKINDVNDFISDKMIEIGESEAFDKYAERKAFETTFRILSNIQGADSFRKFDSQKGKFSGGFLLSAYEVISFGIGKFHSEYENLDNYEILKNKIFDLWNEEEYRRYSGSGVRASSRIPKLVEFGRKYFKP